MTTRRHVLEWLAAAPMLAACGGGALPDPIAAWRDPGAGETDLRRFALAHAILAPNPHNTQPWLVELDDADGMTLYCDLDRRLPFTDPLDRQITIGCGCFIELYRIASAQRGYAPAIEDFPEGEPAPRLDARPVARVRIGARTGDPYPDPSAAAILDRRTNRKPFDARVPDTQLLEELANVVGGMGEDYAGGVYWTTEPARVAQTRDLVWRAWDRELRTQGAAAETFEWLRFGREEIARHGDGLAIDAPGVGIFRMLGQLDREELVDPESQANKTAARDWRELAMTAPAFLWLTSIGDTPGARVGAGRAYARIALAATEMGLAIHPWSQALQEYEEMSDLYVEMRTLLAPPEGETAQMLVRIGYGETMPPSPRRGVEPLLRPRAL
ncbi:MAG: twin-arginine translocation pathway signal protein [Hyphomonadaceae bacterium]